MGSSPEEVTALLVAWSNGDQGAADRLTSLVYSELYRLARYYMARERSGHTLQPTALVNEVFVRLTGGKPVQWQDRGHFFAVSAKLMRRILVDFARARRSNKRGPEFFRVPLEGLNLPVRDGREDLVLLDDALRKLESEDPAKSELVELRYFGGLGVEETASVMGVSESTVRRNWNLAKLWLIREMGGDVSGNDNQTGA